MQLQLLKSKIHRATVTDASLHYEGSLTIASDLMDHAQLGAASSILIDGINKASAKTLIRVPQARIGFAKALALFFPEPEFAPGIHPTAVVSDTAQIDPSAHIGPQCVVGDRVKI